MHIDSCTEAVRWISCAFLYLHLPGAAVLSKGYLRYFSSCHPGISQDIGNVSSAICLLRATSTASSEHLVYVCHPKIITSVPKLLPCSWMV